MLKTLFRKQMLELSRVFFYNKRRGTYSLNKGSLTGRIILFVIVYISVAGSFFALSFLIGDPLIAQDMAWIFFMIMSIMAFLLAVIGSGFSASAALFQAKDNEFLLAMPIPPHLILISRMVSVYILGLVFESMIMLPAILYFFIRAEQTFFSVLFCILGFFILGFVILTFTCILGWLIALISSKLKNKSFLTLIIAIVFIGLFIWLRISANSLFRYLAEHGAEIGTAVKGWGYPLYSLGLGMSGDVVGFLVFTGIAAVLFGLTWLIMSKSFNRIVSTKDEAVKKDFSEKQIRTHSISAALRRKEMKRFTSSPNYMLNCGLGLLFLLAAGVLVLIYRNVIQGLSFLPAFQNPLISNMLPFVAAFAVWMLSSMCNIAAPAISLEGHYVWILQTLPVDPFDVFKAKLFVHISLTVVPALFCAVAFVIALKVSVLTAAAMLLSVAAFVFLSAVFMLALDLKRPIMDWTNEVQPIKQNLNVLFGWLAGWGLSLVLGGLYLLLGSFVAPGIYLLVCTVLFVVFALLLLKWMRGKGRVLFANL